MAARDAPRLGHDDGFEELGWSAPGTVLDGRFVIEGRLGQGGMGCVVLARHRELGELRAIKLLRPDRALTQRARQRLAREARAAARIRSPHVVRVFDVVVGEDGASCPYIVMEHLTGETLAARLARAPLSVPAIARIVIEACEALAEAHRNGTVHRDLKPSNLFLTSAPDRDDFVKVLDFGIAKTEELWSATRFDGASTDSRTLLATPAYASPEQLRASNDVDMRSDIWSLGVIIYECLTGHLPFEAGTLAETSTRILRDDPDPLRHHCPDAPAEVERLLTRCLEKKREARLPDARSLVEALAPFAPETAAASLQYIGGLASIPETATEQPSTTAIPAGDVPDGSATLSQSSVATVSLGKSIAHRSEPRRSRAYRRLPLLASVVGLVAAASLAVLAGTRSRHESPRLRRLQSPTAQPIILSTTRAPVVPTSTAVSAPVQSAAAVPVAHPQRKLARRAPVASGGIPRSQTAAAVSNPPIAPLDQLPLDRLIDERK